MFIITDKNNDVLIDYFEEIEYLKNGYPSNKKCRVSYPAEMVNVHEVNMLPEHVTYFKNCYTPEAGFYENPNYEEPKPMESVDENEVIASILQEVSEYGY